MDYGTLRVATPDGQIREYPITAATVIIGRADGNQVVIDHVSVSRRHAQMVIEASKVTIQDLGSGTGTFVGSQRVPGNEAVAIEPGQTIRFGDVEARFVFSDALVPSDSGTTQADGKEAEQTIGVALTSPSQPVAAGSPTTATVNVQNRGTVTDELTIVIVDLPEGWAKVSRPTLSLVPGARDEITVVIQPPKDSTAAAGEYPFSVAVTSKVHGREVRSLGKVTVRAFEGFRITLDPPRAKRDFKVTATNSGNVTLQVALAATDEAREFGYQFEQDSVELAPGEQKTVALAVTPKSKKKLGPTVYRPFRVEARQGASTSPVTADAQLQIKPPLEPYKWPLVGLVAILVLGGIALAILNMGGGGSKKADEVTPTVAASAVATSVPATATPAGLYKGGNGVIANSDPNPPTNDNCLAVRSKASRDGSEILGRLCTGEKVAIKDGPNNEGGFVWWQVQNSAGLVGWAAEKDAAGAVPFILPAP